MNKIERLIKELCPNGVEWEEIGKIIDYEQPTKYLVSSKEYNDNYELPVLTAGQTFILGYTNETEGIYQASKENPVIIFDDFTTSKKWVDFNFKVKSTAMKILKVKSGVSNILIRYVWHYLGTITYSPDQHGRQWISTYSKFKIPIPPLEIQEEIVKILDKFTDYVTELTTELTLRQKQYNYYRDKLLSFENQCYKVVWRNLGDVATFNYGYTAKASESGEVRFIRITDINENGYLKVSDQKYIQSFTDVEKYFVKKGDLLMARTGATYGKTVYYDSDDNAVYASFLIKISPNPELNSRYYWHFSKSNLYWNQADKLVSKAGQPQFNANSLKNIKIPIPSLEIQSRIVQVLDNFDAVCNDLNIGLPKEIELRQKQYEFFRDKLLTFAAEGVYTDSTVQYRQDIIRLLQWVFGPIKVKLGSICDLDRGKRVVKSQLDQHDGYPVFQNSLTPLGYYEKNNRQAMTTFIVCAGAAAEVGYSTIPFWAADDIFTINNSENVVSKYIYHILLHQQDMLKSKVRKASIPRLSRLSIENIQFILPNLNTQIEIVNKLDQFDAICFDLSHGLPKEIELRQKQYEYYRDKLLSFD